MFLRFFWLWCKVELTRVTPFLFSTVDMNLLIFNTSITIRQTRYYRTPQMSYPIKVSFPTKNNDIIIALILYGLIKLWVCVCIMYSPGNGDVIKGDLSVDSTHTYIAVFLISHCGKMWVFRRNIRDVLLPLQG
jgi:hypothetical protein